MRYELADCEWVAISRMLPNKPRGRPPADRLLGSSHAAERGKFSDCQALAHFRMSASRSLWDLNSSRLYISSQKTFSSSSVIGFTSLRDRSSASKARLASSLIIIAFTYPSTPNVGPSWS
jgi:hypothetical protein